VRSLKAPVHPLVYEINARPWLHEISNRAGRSLTLGTVPDDAFEEWRQLGFTHIWLMGIWRVGPRVRQHAVEQWKSFWRQKSPFDQFDEKDVVGSAYAIAGYEPEEGLGGAAGLAQFRETLHQHGLKLILDFIPNHTGLDHPWLTSRPELFVQGHPFFGGTFRRQTEKGMICFAHGKDPYFPSWSDTVQLDFRRAETHAAMGEALRQVAGMCDGVRCDMAMLVLNEVFERNWRHLPVECARPPSEFWQHSIASVREVYPDFLFLAEAYWGLEPILQQLGFDYVYNKAFYDRLVQRAPAAVQDHLLDARPEFLRGAAHFIENHDETRAAAVFPIEEHRAAALLMLATPGLRLLHHGQLAGATLHGKVHFSRFPAEPRNETIENLYAQLLIALKETSVGRGAPLILTTAPAWDGNGSHRNIMAVLWQSGSGHFELAITNLAPHDSQCVIRLPAEILARSKFVCRDLLSTRRSEYSTDLCELGILFELPSSGVQLLRFDPV
jgi:hypothetical protein